MFLGSRRKIKHANKHIREVERVIEEFKKSDCHRLHITDGNMLQLEITRPLPNDLPEIIGDAVHNLRSALDIAAYDIVKMTGQEPSRDITFPFNKSRDLLVAKINKGQIKVAGTDIVNLIADVIKPYKGGNDQLYGLHLLDIDDKHHFIIPLLMTTGVSGVEAEGDEGGLIVGGTFLTNSQGIANMVQTGENWNITNKGKPVFNVVFDDGQPFQGEAVISTLHQLSQLASGIIDEIEKTYLAKGNAI